jgi:fatty-acid peroxygenase
MIEFGQWIAPGGPLAASTEFPREPGLDQSPALMAEGYRYMGNRFQRHGSDVFQVTLMLQRATCVMGEDAARMLYVPDRFTRRGALPPTALMLLQDYGSVAVLDGAAHRLRKRMFMSLMTQQGMEQLYRIAARAWRERQRRWERKARVVLLDEAEAILCRAACAWAGIELTEAEAEARTAEFSAMIDGAGAVGPRNWRGMVMRGRTERWVRGLIDEVRAGELQAAPGSALETIARHQDADGQEMPAEIAAVELINVLRPTVAVARYVTFGALALHQHPQYRAALAESGDEALCFVQEVRRFYPFFPTVAGKVITPFSWRGHPFRLGDWVLLDLYGTNHDPRIWEEPNRFRPERFRGWQGDAHTLIPQGGGEHDSGHRCAGEWITIGLIKTLLGLYVSEMQCDIPRQNMWIDLGRMPAQPTSGFIMENVRGVGAS